MPNPEKPQSTPKQRDFFEVNGEISDFPDPDLHEASTEALRREFEDLFKCSPPLTMSREQLLAAIENLDPKGFLPSTGILNHQELSDAELEKRFREKLSRSGKPSFSPQGLTRAQITDYLNDQLSTDEVLGLLKQIAEAEDKEDIQGTYRRTYRPN